MKKYIFLTIMLICGCSSNRVLIQPQAVNDQAVVHNRGAYSLHSHSPLKLKLAILDYAYDEIIISLSTTNTSSEPILFSEKNIEVELLASEELQPAFIYSYEQLTEEAAEKGESNLALIGNTVAGIGASFIPFGNIAYSVGRLFYSLNENTEEHQKRIDAFTFSQLNQNYLRQQSIEPGSTYSGILKIGFENDLEKGDDIIFRVSAGNEVEEFSFTCNEYNPSLD
jgi:hypothetical protein